MRWSLAKSGDQIAMNPKPVLIIKLGKPFIVATTLAIAAAAIAAWYATRSTPVELSAVDTRDVSEVYVVTGRVRSRTTSHVGSELAGRVALIHVREGSTLRRGEPLVDLQPLDAKLAVQQAEANLEIAKQELDRARRGPTKAQRGQVAASIASSRTDLKLAQQELERASEMVREGIGTSADLQRAQGTAERARASLALASARADELEDLPRSADVSVARARVAAAEANVEQTRATLGKTTIVAPFDGLVLEVGVYVGESVRPADKLVTLARTDELEFYTEVDESYYGRLESGQKATAVFSSKPSVTYAAVVGQIGPDVDPDLGVLPVHITPDALPEDVMPGLSADIAIELLRIEGARSVPVDALARQRGTYVFVIDDGAARRVDVQVQAEGEEYVAVTGLDGVGFVIRNIAMIEEGQRVREAAP